MLVCLKKSEVSTHLTNGCPPLHPHPLLPKGKEKNKDFQTGIYQNEKESVNKA